jgi:hypothetical protein
MQVYSMYCVTSLPSMVAWVVKTVATLILQVLIWESEKTKTGRPSSVQNLFFVTAYLCEDKLRAFKQLTNIVANVMQLWHNAANAAAVAAAA